MVKIYPEVAQLLVEIEAYRARAGIDKTNFGLDAMGDGNFITRLEHGRNPRFETIDRVKSYINRKTRAVRK
jgi:hypothetical protein